MIQHWINQYSSNKYGGACPSEVSFTTNTTQGQPPPLNKKQSSRWKNRDLYHPMMTLSYYDVVEAVKDVQEDHRDECKDDNDLKNKIVEKYEITEQDKQMTQRIDEAILEAKAQDIVNDTNKSDIMIDEIPLLGIGDFTLLRSDASYARDDSQSLSQTPSGRNIHNTELSICFHINYCFMPFL